MADRKRVRPSKRFWKLQKRGWGGIAIGAAGGAVAGTVVPGIGTAVGAFIGALGASGAVSVLDWGDLIAERKKTHPDENRRQRWMAILESMMDEDEGDE